MVQIFGSAVCVYHWFDMDDCTIVPPCLFSIQTASRHSCCGILSGDEKLLTSAIFYQMGGDCQW